MMDNVFDQLEWADDCWQTSVEIPFFREGGARLCEGTEGVTRRSAPSGGQGSAIPNPPIPLTIDTGGERRGPSNAQLDAWRRIRERGEDVWRQCAQRVRPEYELQRPARLRWWTATYGPAGWEDVLPDLGGGDASFASLIVPVHVRIHEPAGKSSVADVGVKFACTWDTDGCGVLIRDGEVAEVGDSSVAFPATVPVLERTTHPALGALRRIQAGGPWIGEVTIEPFLNFARIAATRVAFQRDPANTRKRSNLDWHFARGEFHLFIYVAPGAYSLDQAAAALASFQGDVIANSSAILQAIVTHYIQTREDRRRAYRGTDIDEKFPEIASPDGLRDLIQLTEVNLFPPANGPGGALGFVFVGFEKGVGVRWRDGAVEEVGLPRIARPQRQR